MNDATQYDGYSGEQLAVVLGLPAVHLFATIPSTMDAAHDLAGQGAPSGTAVLTDHQSAGRGRHTRAWLARPGSSITLTIVERDVDRSAIRVLSLRAGLAVAAALDAWGDGRVQLKWPNDLIGSTGKIGGILIETRWRAGLADWVAIGVGLNLAPVPGVAGAGFIASQEDRIQLLRELIPAIRTAAAAMGDLTFTELQEFASRDWADGRRVRFPAAGVVRGIDESGGLVIEGRNGLSTYVGGSLQLEEDEYDAGV